MFTETEQYEMLRLAEDILDRKKQECRLLEAIIRETEYPSIGPLKNKITRFLGDQEDNFLEAKKMAYLLQAGSRASSYDFEKMGVTENFPCSLSLDDGVWEFYLPPTPSVKNGKLAVQVGRYTGYLVQNLIKEFEELHGKIERLTSPVVVLEYGLDKSTPLSRYYDADNRDNKRILDAMTGTFYEDDNVMTIKTFHYGVLSDSAYTRAYVMGSPLFPSWFSARF